MQILKTAAFAALMLCVPAAANAQSAPPYGASITLNDAKKVIAAAEAEVRKNNWTMVITVVDAAGHPVAMERFDGTQLGSIRIAEGKARSAVEFRRSSKAFQDAVAGGGEGLRILSMSDVTAIEGGELLLSGGKIVGAIGVSGGSPAQDGEVARAGVAALGK